MRLKVRSRVWSKLRFYIWAAVSLTMNLADQLDNVGKGWRRQMHINARSCQNQIHKRSTIWRSNRCFDGFVELNSRLSFPYGRTRSLENTIQVCWPLTLHSSLVYTHTHQDQWLGQANSPLCSALTRFAYTRKRLSPLTIERERESEQENQR